MKLVNYLLIGLSFALIVAGLTVQVAFDNPVLMARLYGSGVLILFFVWIPIFLIWRSQKTKLLDHLDKNKTKEENE